MDSHWRCNIWANRLLAAGTENQRFASLQFQSPYVQRAMSTSTKFTVRAATREDGPFLAWVLLQAGRSQHPRGLFERVLGSKYSEEQLLTILTDFILYIPPGL